jgi:acyl-CoA synthetase (AMP-forming)/AMP-acid ligase II
LTWLFAVLFAGHVPAFTPPLSSNPDYRAHLAHLYTLLDCPTVLTSNNNRHYFEGETNFAVITAEELRDAAPNSNGLTLNGHHSKSIDGLEDAHASNGTNGQSLSGLEEDIALLMLTSGSTGNAKAVSANWGSSIFLFSIPQQFLKTYLYHSFET